MVEQVIWSQKALRDLSKVVRYGEKEFGRKTAIDFYSKIKENDFRLLTNPELGMIEPSLTDCRIEYRSLVVHKNYKLIYYITKSTVRVAALWDCRQIPNRLSQFLK